jgi:hypothetical protein
VLFTATQSAGEARIREIPFIASAPVSEQDAFVKDITSTVVDSAGAALPVISGFLVQQGAPQEFADQVQIAASEGFTDGVKATGWAAAGFLFLGLLSTFSMGARRRPEEKKSEVTATE